MKIQDIQINSLYRNSSITIYCEKDDLKELMEFRKKSNIEFGKNYTRRLRGVWMRMHTAGDCVTRLLQKLTAPKKKFTGFTFSVLESLKMWQLLMQD